MRKKKKKKKKKEVDGVAQINCYQNRVSILA